MPYDPLLTYTYEGCPASVEALKSAIERTRKEMPTYNLLNIFGRNCSGMACQWLEDAGFVAPFDPTASFLIPIGGSREKRYDSGRDPRTGGRAGW